MLQCSSAVRRRQRRTASSSNVTEPLLPSTSMGPSQRCYSLFVGSRHFYRWKRDGMDYPVIVEKHCKAEGYVIVEYEDYPQRKRLHKSELLPVTPQRERRYQEAKERTFGRGRGRVGGGGSRAKGKRRASSDGTVTTASSSSLSTSSQAAVSAASVYGGNCDDDDDATTSVASCPGAPQSVDGHQKKRVSSGGGRSSARPKQGGGGKKKQRNKRPKLSPAGKGRDGDRDGDGDGCDSGTGSEGCSETDYDSDTDDDDDDDDDLVTGGWTDARVSIEGHVSTFWDGKKRPGRKARHVIRVRVKVNLNDGVGNGVGGSRQILGHGHSQRTHRAENEEDDIGDDDDDDDDEEEEEVKERVAKKYGERERYEEASASASAMGKSLLGGMALVPRLEMAAVAAAAATKIKGPPPLPFAAERGGKESAPAEEESGMNEDDRRKEALSRAEDEEMSAAAGPFSFDSSRPHPPNSGARKGKKRVRVSSSGGGESCIGADGRDGGDDEDEGGDDECAEEHAPDAVGPDGHHYLCRLCRRAGNLVCCDACPCVYHPKCLDQVDRDRLDDDPWFCPECCDENERASSALRERIERRLRAKKKGMAEAAGAAAAETTLSSTVAATLSPTAAAVCGVKPLVDEIDEDEDGEEDEAEKEVREHGDGLGRCGENRDEGCHRARAGEGKGRDDCGEEHRMEKGPETANHDGGDEGMSERVGNAAVPERNRDGATMALPDGSESLPDEKEGSAALLAKKDHPSSAASSPPSTLEEEGAIRTLLSREDRATKDGKGEEAERMPIVKSGGDCVGVVGCGLLVSAKPEGEATEAAKPDGAASACARTMMGAGETSAAGAEKRPVVAGEIRSAALEPMIKRAAPQCRADDDDSAGDSARPKTPTLTPTTPSPLPAKGDSPEDKDRDDPPRLPLTLSPSEGARCSGMARKTDFHEPSNEEDESKSDKTDDTQEGREGGRRDIVEEKEEKGSDDASHRPRPRLSSPLPICRGSQTNQEVDADDSAGAADYRSQNVPPSTPPQTRRSTPPPTRRRTTGRRNPDLELWEHMGEDRLHSGRLRSRRECHAPSRYADEDARRDWSPSRVRNRHRQGVSGDRDFVKTQRGQVVGKRRSAVAGRDRSSSALGGKGGGGGGSGGRRATARRGAGANFIVRRGGNVSSSRKKDTAVVVAAAAAVDSGSDAENDDGELVRRLADEKEGEEQQQQEEEEEEVVVEVWDLLRALPRSTRIRCMKEGCRAIAVATWATNLNRRDVWHCCADCQLEEFGGWPEDFVVDVEKDEELDEDEDEDDYYYEEMEMMQDGGAEAVGKRRDDGGGGDGGGDKNNDDGKDENKDGDRDRGEKKPAELSPMGSKTERKNAKGIAPSAPKSGSSDDRGDGKNVDAASPLRKHIRMPDVKDKVEDGRRLGSAAVSKSSGSVKEVTAAAVDDILPSVQPKRQPDGKAETAVEPEDWGVGSNDEREHTSPSSRKAGVRPNMSKKSGTKKISDGECSDGNDADDAEEDDDEELWEIVRALPSKTKLRCKSDSCNKKAVASWAPNGDKKKMWNCCAQCQINIFGGWPEDFLGNVSKENELDVSDDSSAGNGEGEREKKNASDGKEGRIDADLQRKEAKEQDARGPPKKRRKLLPKADDIHTKHNLAVESDRGGTKQAEKVNTKRKDRPVAGNKGGKGRLGGEKSGRAVKLAVGSAGNSDSRVATGRTASGRPSSARPTPACPTPAHPAMADLLATGAVNEQKQNWHFVCHLPPNAPLTCMKDGCNRRAVVTWATALRPNDFWHCCGDCERSEFDGTRREQEEDETEGEEEEEEEEEVQGVHEDEQEEQDREQEQEQGQEREQDQEEKNEVKEGGSSTAIDEGAGEGEGASSRVILRKYMPSGLFQEWLSDRKKKWRKARGQHRAGSREQCTNERKSGFDREPSNRETLQCAQQESHSGRTEVRPSHGGVNTGTAANGAPFLQRGNSWPTHSGARAAASLASPNDRLGQMNHYTHVACGVGDLRGRDDPRPAPVRSRSGFAVGARPCPGAALPPPAGMASVSPTSAPTSGARVADTIHGQRPGVGVSVGASQMAGMPPPPTRFASPGLTPPRVVGAGAPGASYHHVRLSPQNERAAAPAAVPVVPWEERPFPMRLHWVVSNPEFRDIIAWLPGGRSWSILNRKIFEERVMPVHFRQDNYASFIAQVNEWGFRRLTYGTGHESYHHEFFLRGVHHMVHKMVKPTRQSLPQAKVSGRSSDHHQTSANSQIHSLTIAAPRRLTPVSSAHRSSGAAAAVAGMLNLSVVPVKCDQPNNLRSTLSFVTPPGNRTTAPIACQGVTGNPAVNNIIYAGAIQKGIVVHSDTTQRKPETTVDGQKEVWELVCTVPNSVGIKCMKSGCPHLAVASYSSNVFPRKYWHTCESCQRRDFGSRLAKDQTATQGSNGATQSSHPLVAEDTYLSWSARKEKMLQHSRKGNTRDVGPDDGSQKRIVSSESESSSAQDSGLPWEDDGRKEEWRIVGSINTCFGKKCMKAGCSRDAMSTWATDLRPDEKWHVCSDCEPRMTQLFHEHAEGPENSAVDTSKLGDSPVAANTKHVPIVSSDDEERRKMNSGITGTAEEPSVCTSPEQSVVLPTQVTSSKATDEIQSMDSQSPTRNSALSLLVRNKQWDKVRSLLGLNDPLEAWCGSDGRTALHEAVVMGAPSDVVKSIASAGPRMFTKDNLGFTPLDLAIRGPDTIHLAEIVKVLLAYGPKPRKDTKITRDNPLHQACRMDCSLNVILEIVSAYPEFVLEPDENGDTPLHVSCSRRMSSEKVISIIRHSPAACAMVNQRGETPLHIACFLCDKETIQALVKTFPGALMAVDKRGCTAEKYMKSRRDLGDTHIGGCTTSTA